MALSKPDVIDVVTKALKEVADWKGDIGEVTFEKFTEFHKQVFINGVALHLSLLGYGVTLSKTKLGTFKSISDLIGYIFENRTYQGPPHKKITL